MQKKVPVTISQKDLDAERRRPDWTQCKETYFGRSIVFCRRPEGHDGDHRGQGAQWQTIDSKED